jgi:hypothetical protein
VWQLRNMRLREVKWLALGHTAHTCMIYTWQTIFATRFVEDKLEMYTRPTKCSSHLSQWFYFQLCSQVAFLNLSILWVY